MISREFSTSALPPEARAPYWASTTASFFGDLRTESPLIGSRAFDASLTAYQMGEIQVIRVAGPEHRVWRQADRAESAVSDSYKLILQVRGCGLLEQGENTIALNPGEWSIYDPRLTYSITNRQPMEVLVLLIPRHPLRHFRLGEVQRPLNGRPELDSMQALFSEYLHSLARQLPTLPDASGSTFADTTLGLLVSTLATRQAEKDLQKGNPDVMRMRVKQFIANNLVDPDLSIDGIAHEMNCSKRYLHKLFEDDGMTLDRYIWNARLERCRDALAGHRERQGGISRIAFSWGFNSNAHFCRMFKSRFGVSPRQFQSTAQAA